MILIPVNSGTFFIQGFFLPEPHIIKGNNRESNFLIRSEFGQVLMIESQAESILENINGTIGLP